MGIEYAPFLPIGVIGQVYDHGVSRWTSFGGVNLSDGHRIASMSTEPIDGLGGDRDDVAPLKQCDGFLDVREKVHVGRLPPLVVFIH